MCGRFSLTARPEELGEWFDVADIDPYPPRFNIAPTQPILTVRIGEADRREAVLVRWGLVPGWVKDPADFTLIINARSETAASKPSFRAAMRHRRTLVPASGFYEWRAVGDKKQPYWIKPRHGGIVAFAGLMETWMDAAGSEIDSGCIVTTRANEALGVIHHRMPVVIEPADFERWLDCKRHGPADVADLLAPVDDAYFEATPVSDRVNKVANMDADIQRPVAPISADAPADRTEPAGRDDQLKLF